MNAKELVLDKINAGSELVSLYVAGITFGMPFTDLTNIIISPTIDTISKIMKEDSFNGYDGMARFDQVIKYINNGPSSIFGSILKKEVYINKFIEALEEAAKKGGQISIIQEIKNSIENNKNTSSNQDDEDFDDYILYEEPIDEESTDEESTKYNSYHLRKMLTSLNWTSEMAKIFLDLLSKSDSHYKWIRLIDDLEKWFDIKELINNDIISYSTNPKYIPNIVYHYSDNENLIEFTKIDDNYFTKFKNGTPNAIFFTDTPSPASDTLLAKRAKRYAVKLNVDKVKYIYGTKEDLHNLGTDYTEQVNLAELEGYDAVRFIGIDDNQELNQNITVIFDPSKAKIIDDSLIPKKKIYEFNGDWTRHSVSIDTNSLYIFTDNTDRDSGKTLINPDSEYARKYGKNKHYPTTTQAVIRGLDNAMPISTQRWYHNGAKGNFGRWTDDAFEEFKQTIDTEIEAIKQKWDTGNYSRLVVGSIAGFFNTKISNITKERVPKIYDYLLIKLNELFEYINNSQINNTSQQSSGIRKFDEAVKLYRASTEMTSLVSYFGLNQGIPTDPNELIAIRTKFESMFEDAINFKNPNNKQTIYKGEKITVVEAIKKIKENRKIFPVEKIYKISMNDFFADESYRNEVVEAYNAIKEFQNIPYILIHNEHYYSYMELISILINVYSKVSKKFKTINDFADSIIKKVNVYKSDEKLRVLKSIENSIDTIINNTWMSTTFEPFIIPEGIISIDASGKPYTTTAPTPIILGTDWGNKAFKIYIEQKVIPDLQAGKLGPNIIRSLGNRLLNALTPMIDSDVTNNMDIVYTLPIEMIPKTPEEEVIFNSYKDSLSNLRNVQYDNGFEKHSVINLLYLYNMITYNNKVSKYALTGLFGSLIQAHNLDIHEKYIKFIADYDNNNIELKGFNLTSIAQRAAPIGNRYNAKTNMIKELNSSTGKYVLYEKGESGYQYRNYMPLSTGNIFKNSIVLSPNITITISSNGELESIFTSKGNLDIEEYNKTVASEYQIKSKKDLLVVYKQIVNGKEIDTLDIKLTLENINRVLNNPC